MNEPIRLRDAATATGRSQESIRRAVVRGQAAREGDDLESEWDFLPTMRFAEMDALRARAQAYLEDRTFSVDGWRAFIANEASVAWDRYNPLVLPPDPVEPIEVGFEARGGRRYRGRTRSERLSR